jgi:hypothetical protein
LDAFAPSNEGIRPVRLLLSIVPVFFIASVQGALADEHRWTLARGTDFKIYNKCVAADGLSPPQQTYESAVKVGLSAKLEDKGNEVVVDLDLKTTSLIFRWFRTEACNSAAQSNHGANVSLDSR